MKEQQQDKPVVLSPKQHRAIQVLLLCFTKEKAAEELGINVTTLWRWLKIPEFKDALREAQREANSQTNARLQQSAPLAVNTLLRVISSPDTPASSKVQASRTIILLSQKSIEWEDTEARLARLEKLAA